MALSPFGVKMAARTVPAPMGGLATAQVQAAGFDAAPSGVRTREAGGPDWLAGGEDCLFGAEDGDPESGRPLAPSRRRFGGGERRAIRN